MPAPSPVPDTGCGPEPLRNACPSLRLLLSIQDPHVQSAPQNLPLGFPRPPRAERKEDFSCRRRKRKARRRSLCPHPEFGRLVSRPCLSCSQDDAVPLPTAPVTLQQGLPPPSPTRSTAHPPSLTLSPHSTAREAPFQDTRGSSCSLKQNPAAPLHFSRDKGEDSVLGQSSQPIGPPQLSLPGSHQAPLHPALQPHRPATPPCHPCHHTSHTPLPTPLPRPLSVPPFPGDPPSLARPQLSGPSSPRERSFLSLKVRPVPAGCHHTLHLSERCETKSCKHDLVSLFEQ